MESQGKRKGAEMAAEWCQKGDLGYLWTPMGSHAVSDPSNPPFPGVFLVPKPNKHCFQNRYKNESRKEAEHKCQGRQKGAPMEPKENTQMEKNHVRDRAQEGDRQSR